MIELKEQSGMGTKWKIEKICEGLQEFLLEKNKRYGDSALKPEKIFSKADAENSILIRLDDKINRIKNSKELRKNDLVDIVGYGILLLADKEWISFKGLLD